MDISGVYITCCWGGGRGGHRGVRSQKTLKVVDSVKSAVRDRCRRRSHSPVGGLFLPDVVKSGGRPRRRWRSDGTEKLAVVCHLLLLHARVSNVLKIGNLVLPGGLATPRAGDSPVEVRDVVGFAQDREFRRSHRGVAVSVARTTRRSGCFCEWRGPDPAIHRASHDDIAQNQIEFPAGGLQGRAARRPFPFRSPCAPAAHRDFCYLGVGCTSNTLHTPAGTHAFLRHPHL